MKNFFSKIGSWIKTQLENYMNYVTDNPRKGIGWSLFAITVLIIIVLCLTA